MGGGTLEAEVDLEHTKDGGDERTEIVSLVDGVEVSKDGAEFFPGNAVVEDAFIGDVDNLSAAGSGGVSE